MATPSARTVPAGGVYFTNMAFKDEDMPWGKDEEEKRAHKVSKEQEEEGVNEISIWEQPSSYPHIRRWLDKCEKSDEHIPQQKALE